MSNTTPSPEKFPILIDFPDEEGLMQVSLSDDMDKWLEKSQTALDNAMLTIIGMAYRTSQLRDQIPAEFTQAEIEFGVKLSA